MNATEIIKEVARQNCTSEDVVRTEIEKVIDISMRNNKDFWHNEFHTNKKPSVEEFLILILSKIKNTNTDI